MLLIFHHQSHIKQGFGSRIVGQNAVGETSFYPVSNQKPNLAIQDLYDLKKNSIVVILDLIAISITFLRNFRSYFFIVCF